MREDVDLERRLGELFAADDLTVVPRPGATATVLRGVRRRRRRRRLAGAAAGCAAALVAVLLTPRLMTHHDGPDVLDPAETLTPPRTSTELQMVGTAVGSLRLGMSRAEAERTGLVTNASVQEGEPPGCLTYPGRSGITSVVLGPDGVEDIEIYPFITTPEGVQIGDPVSSAQRVYPGLPTRVTDDNGTTVTVPVPHEPRARYRITVAPHAGRLVVAGITLASATTRCDVPRA